MRILLAVPLICALTGAPASALPIVKAGMAAQAAPLHEVKAKARAARATHAKKDKSLGGIHPLVGSGDY